MSNMDASAGLPVWVERLGIRDVDSAVDVAEKSWSIIQEPAFAALKSWSDVTTASMVFSGFLVRAQGLHEGTISAVREDNPYAAFTLLRALSENVAAVLYVIDNPKSLDKFWRERDTRGVAIGKITNHALRRMENFRTIYSQLSQYAHPHSGSLLAAFDITEAGRLSWSSTPTFRSESDKIYCCAWVCELAEAMSHLLREYAIKFGLTLTRSDETHS
ncbi:hypothetical protein [Pseudonocardia sp.]|uniref:hypothetical protein n=1 Tax=Pseudonocardia sp. TaxID=60912 RepID=UPI003D124D3C